jgi:hypothetical protein
VRCFAPTLRRSGYIRAEVLLIPLCAAAVFTPSVIRNYQVFGCFVLSTKSGADAL